MVIRIIKPAIGQEKAEAVVDVSRRLVDCWQAERSSVREVD